MRLFKQHCPSKLTSVPGLWKKYQGRETELLFAIKCKYESIETDEPYISASDAGLDTVKKVNVQDLLDGGGEEIDDECGACIQSEHIHEDISGYF